MSNLMLRLDDAVDVAVRYINEYMDEGYLDRDLIRSEMEQKCYLPIYDEAPRAALVDLIMDVNPVEIASQIEEDHLREWCMAIQVNLQMLLMQIGGNNA